MILRTLCDIIYADVTRPVFRTLLHNKNGAPNVLRTTDPKGKLKMKKLVMGNEAIAYGALAAGVSVVTGYPGTPSTEVLETVAKLKKRGRLPDVYVEWSVNEKTALEVAAGASYSGARTLVTMKQVGLNVASDPLMSLEYVGLRGGMVILVADDPGPISSQTEQDTRTFASFSKVPVFDPSSPEEAFAMMPEAYKLSEKYETPVFMRPTTRICHANATLEIPEAFEAKKADGFIKDPSRWVIFPRLSYANHKKIEERNAALSDTLSSYGRNSVSGSGRLGIAAGGVSVAYALEALSLLRAENGEIPDIKFMKTATPFPFPEKLAADFLRGLDEVLVFEELDPVIEEQVKSWGIKAIGKEIFTVQGEYSANMLREAILKENLDIRKPAEAPGRPPILCPGCPHRGVYYVLKKLGIHAAGDIGCYTLGAVAPLSVVDTTICMGASISSLHGMEKAKGKDYIKNWVAVIGDSTFLHTGVNSLMNMMYNKATGTVMILDNSTTGMTGHQDHAATGKTLQGDPTYAIDIPALCRAIGVKNVVEVNARDIQAVEKAVKEEIAKDEVSVIITKTPCVLLDKSKKPLYQTHIDKCKKCGMCMKPGCPAMTKNPDGTVSIDDTMCTGCGLCASLCKFDAIELVKEGDR